MVIMAAAAGVVILNAPPAPSAAKDAAMKFAYRLNTVYDDAIVTGAVFRLEISTQAYRFQRLRDGDWSAVYAADASNDWRGVSLSVELDEAAARNVINDETGQDRLGEDTVTTIDFDPLGDNPGFSTIFQSPRGAWAVDAGADGRVQVRRY